MLYQSTRGWLELVPASRVITAGIAPDGGLFVPSGKVTLNSLAFLAGLTYQEQAAAILTPFLTEFDPGDIAEWAEKAYRPPRFDNPDIAPVRQLKPGLHILELWHGPTCAFKDMALQLLPHLLKASRKKTGVDGEAVILVATSGDTGKVALESFRDIKGTRIIVFYPEEGVSEIQKRQMITQEGENVYVVAVRGNFDDAQNGVKAIFSDRAINEKLAQKGFLFSSANSINWGRLAPQIVYYYSAYLQLVTGKNIRSGEEVNFVVPTGNFGNILAGFYARQMGLPVGRLICASNMNNVLTDFIRSGVYNRSRSFFRTASPSMDILISSNLERLLFELSGKDAEKVTRWMNELQQDGGYRVDPATAGAISELFWSDFADDRETASTIERIFSEYAYPLDTHTAVGMAVYEKYRAAVNDERQTVLVSTASPFKFNESVACALLGEEAVKGRSEFDMLKMLSDATGWPIPPGLRDLDRKPVRHRLSVNKEEMKQAVGKLLIP